MGGVILRCSQTKEWSRVDATCHCARWQVAAHKESSRVDSLANTLSSLAFSQLSVGLGWGPPLPCSGEAKAEAQE